MVDLFLNPKIKKYKLIFRIAFFLFFLVFSGYFILSQNKSNKYVDSLLIDGYVREIGRISGEKGTYLLIDTSWFYTLGYGLSDTLMVNDHIIKRTGKKITIIRPGLNEKTNEIFIDNVFISEVVDEKILKILLD